MAAMKGGAYEYGLDWATPPDASEWQRAEAYEEWQAAVAAWEDGLTDVEPVEFEEWF